MSDPIRGELLRALYPFMTPISPHRFRATTDSDPELQSMSGGPPTDCLSLLPRRIRNGLRIADLLFGQLVVPCPQDHRLRIWHGFTRRRSILQLKDDLHGREHTLGIAPAVLPVPAPAEPMGKLSAILAIYFLAGVHQIFSPPLVGVRRADQFWLGVRQLSPGIPQIDFFSVPQFTLHHVPTILR